MPSGFFIHYGATSTQTKHNQVIDDHQLKKKTDELENRIRIREKRSYSNNLIGYFQV